MQLSIKPPPELTLPILEKCAVLQDYSPSAFASDCTWQCLSWMDTPHRKFSPLAMVEKYYHSLGKEHVLNSKRTAQDLLLRKLLENDRVERAESSKDRLASLKLEVKKKTLRKHLHLKISQGKNSLPQKIIDKAVWLRTSPNALVVACVGECIDAMDDPQKALVPPPIVVAFWTTSKAKLRPRASRAQEAMVFESQEAILRARTVPIMDTIVRLALSENWDVSLRQILDEAQVTSA